MAIVLEIPLGNIQHHAKFISKYDVGENILDSTLYSKNTNGGSVDGVKDYKSIVTILWLRSKASDWCELLPLIFICLFFLTRQLKPQASKSRPFCKKSVRIR